LDRLVWGDVMVERDDLSAEERVALLRAWSARMIGPIGVAAGPCSPDALRMLGELLVAQGRWSAEADAALVAPEEPV
jgi:hypothetical protein